MTKLKCPRCGALAEKHEFVEYHPKRWKCPKCGKTKSEFKFNGYQTCEDCRANPTRKSREEIQARKNAYDNETRARKLHQTLRGTDPKALEAFYQEAQRRTKETGVKHSVDHKIPLLGKLVRGLHVPWNLQVMPLIDNIKKGNRT